MQFRLLGPLEVLVEERAATSPPGAERELLAVLLLHSGRVVTAAALIDVLWGTDPPADPGNALQQRVSKLRRALAAAGLPRSLVEHRPPGYVLRIDRATVDAHRFADLVGEARGLAEHQPVAADRRYADALALWRGPALADFADAIWTGPHVARLEELRLAATEERIELGLAAGRHGDLVGELESLVTAHPLRERLHAQLMLALYRSGRQAEALAAYQRARSRLADELGLDPSAELRELEQAILRHASRLDAPAPARARYGTALPIRVASLVGRSEVLEQAGELLALHRLVTMTGPGGVGKTTVALAAAARAAADHPDGVLLVRLAGIAEAAGVSAAMADALGVGAQGVGVGRGPGDPLVRALGDRAVLVVLDNCEHLADACAALAERLLGGCPGLRLLATSREPLAVGGEVQLPIPPLDSPPPDAPPSQLARYDAARLFLDRARAARPDFTSDPETLRHVARICRALDGIPLAVELAGALVPALAAGEIAARLDDRFRLLIGGPRTADARQQTLWAAVDWSHRLLTDAEKVLFRRLATFRGGWSLAAAERVCAGADLDPADVLGLLVRLVDRSLVVADPACGGRFRMLETMRHLALDRLAGAGEAARLAQSHATDVVAVAEAGEADLRGPGQRGWLRWLRTERDNVDAALRWCRAHARSHPDLGLRLVAALGWFSYFASRPSGAPEIAAMLAAAHGGSPEPTARALLALALAGRPGACVVHPSSACAAAARASLAMFVRLGQTHRAAYARALLAVESIGAVDVSEARGLLSDAGAEFDRVDDRWGQALVEFVRMDLHNAAGEFADATPHADRALSIFQETGDHWGVSAIRFHRGRALHRAGALQEAERAYEEALADGREVGLANTEQYALAHLGHVRLLLGDDAGAASDFAQAHAVARELGAAGSPLASVGEALLARQRGDLEHARRHYITAIEQLDKRQPAELTAAAHAGLGFVAELTGDPGEARAQHLAAWDLGSRDPTPEPVGGAAASLEGLACLAAARADGHAAAGLLGAAAGWRERRSRPANVLERLDIERASMRARDLIGAPAYDLVFTAAKRLPAPGIP